MSRLSHVAVALKLNVWSRSCPISRTAYLARRGRDRARERAAEIAAATVRRLCRPRDRAGEGTAAQTDLPSVLPN
jgi:hypothetical protein